MTNFSGCFPTREICCFHDISYLGLNSKCIQINAVAVKSSLPCFLKFKNFGQYITSFECIDGNYWCGIKA